MGVFAIANFLEENGFGVKIINYPLEKYLNRNWKLSEYIKTIDFDVCGIDLHWIHNSHGAIEIAKEIKKIKPNCKIVLGGFSASYYHSQILKYYSVIDGVFRGEAEVPILKYIQAYKQNQSLDSVPNLTYRDSSNHIKINPQTYIAKSLDHLNFSELSTLKNFDAYLKCSRKVMGISFNLSMGRGCPFNCPLCGGGQRAQQSLTGREEVILRKPEKVLEDISYVISKYKNPGFFFGHGTYPATLKYWKRLFELIRKENYDISGDLEIWRLPFPKDMWMSFSKTFKYKDSSISISPRTLSSQAQQKIAKICDPTFKFPKNQINDLIKNANLFQRTLRIWLTIGFPFQTYLDVLKDFQFAFKSLIKYGPTNLKPISLMTEPFYVFPGSPAHKSPKDFGLSLKFNSFIEVVEAFKRSKLSFFYNVLNYDKERFSQTFIRTANKFQFLMNAPLFLTSFPKAPKESSK